MDRELRKQQEEEFQQALKMDEERETKAQMEAAKKKQEESRLDSVIAHRQSLKLKFQDEPEPSERTAAIAIRLPDGGRVQRRFDKSTKVQVRRLY